MPAFSGHVPNPYASVAYWYDDPLQSSEQQSLHIEGAVWTASGGQMYGPSEKVMQEGSRAANIAIGDSGKHRKSRRCSPKGQEDRSG
jgi:hypothetical protein